MNIYQLKKMDHKYTLPLDSENPQARNFSVINLHSEFKQGTYPG